MGTFSPNEMPNVIVHPAKGMTWSKGALIVKRRSFPKGAIPPHLEGKTRDFTSAVKDCASKVRNLKGAERVRALNACVGSRLKKGR